MVARPIVVTTALNAIPIWLTANLLVGPLLALLSVPPRVVVTAVFASSRESDPRAVQQVVAFMVVPIVLLGAAQVTGYS